ncbi:50S ribosomal protein L15 [candidate division KSB1 bacterium]|nr:MAG: 50S ribosomal protein L15 [candidate division KSB1 bacterium]
MDLSSLHFAPGAKKKSKRVGRGHGSGLGKTSGRGMKGQRSRSGSKTRSWFEGGQMPLQRRVPKRGFTNIFKKRYEIVNLDDLKNLKKAKLTPEDLYNARLIRKKESRVKILGDGEVSSSIEINAHAFSKKAVEKIEKAGGKAVKL